MNLIQGHTYLVEANIYTTNPNVSASATISWDETIPGASDIRSGGGLRVKSITNYDISGDFISKENYQYGSDNTGTLLTPQYYQDINYETVVHRAGGDFILGESACRYKYEYEVDVAPIPGFTTIYHANSVLPTSQYSGSPVLYKEVTKTQVDASGNPNGKTVYSFGVYEDGASTPFEPLTGTLTNYNPKAGMHLVTRTWRNGFLTNEEVYKSVSSTYQSISKKTISYTDLQISSQNVLKVKNNYIHIGCKDQNVIADFSLSFLPFETGARVPSSIVTTQWDDNGNTVVNTQSFTYGGSSLMPTKMEAVSSTGQTLIENLKYPGDLALAGNVYQKMIDRNIISPLVQKQQVTNGTKRC